MPASTTNFHRAELVERSEITPDLAIFRFRPDGPFTFQAGQFATLALEAGDKRIQRAYSIASSPEEPLLEFFIELVEGGKLTSRIWELKVGDSLMVRKRQSHNAPRAISQRAHTGRKIFPAKRLTPVILFPLASCLCSIH